MKRRIPENNQESNQEKESSLHSSVSLCLSLSLSLCLSVAAVAAVDVAAAAGFVVDYIDGICHIYIPHSFQLLIGRQKDLPMTLSAAAAVAASSSSSSSGSSSSRRFVAVCGTWGGDDEASRETINKNSTKHRAKRQLDVSPAYSR